MIQKKPRFCELTLIEAVNLYRHLNQAQFEHQMLYFSLSQETLPRHGLSVENKANALTKFVIENPFHQTAEGESLDEGIIKRTIEVPQQWSRSAIGRALARDGYTQASDGSLIRNLPPIADLPEANDELYSLLDELNLPVGKGHLDQAIRNHSDGNWAAANSQLRTFLESVFNDVSKRLDPARATEPLSSDNRRTLLAKINPPFLLESHGEWSGDGKSFINGLFKRLNSEGSHPGLSEEEDCTFRLHLVLVTGRHFLRRAKNRINPY